MHVNHRKGSSDKPLLGASTLTLLNVVVNKHTLVGAFNRCSGLELFLESFRVSGDWREKPQIVVGFDVDCSPIGTIRTFTGFINTMAIEPTPVLDTFGERKSIMLIRNSPHADRIPFIIKAQYTGMRCQIVLSGIGIQRYIGNHLPLVEQPVGCVVIHGSVRKIVFKHEIRIELSDFRQSEDG